MGMVASGKNQDIPRTKKRGVTAGSLRQVPAARNSTTIATVFSTEVLCHSINNIPLLAGGSFPLVGWDPRGKFIKVYRVAFSVHNEHLLRMELYSVNIFIYDSSINKRFQIKNLRVKSPTREQAIILCWSSIQTDMYYV
jgi:hypothetical protein